MKLNKSITSFAMALAVMLGAGLTANAVPAKPGAIPYQMPDGSVVDIYLHGDEYHSFATTVDGYVIKADADHLLHYMVPRDGKLVMSDVLVTNVVDRSAEAVKLLADYDKDAAINILEAERKTAEISSPLLKGPSRAGTNETIGTFPTTGQQKILVILAEYSDVKFSTAQPHVAFDRLMNEVGYTDGGASGSAFDFFTASSNGQFQPQFDVFGPVTLPNTRAYYGAHTSSGGNDIRAAEMIRDACQLLDEEIDFSQYDTDKDGYVDNVYVFYAGNGEADTQIEDCIWPHAWYVYSGGGLFLKLDGKVIDRYACSGELSRTYSGDVLTGIGTFCHEFSHVMGLPDLYATSYTGAFTPGQWTLMDQGSYNNNQRTPPTHSAYERFVLGWITPEVLEDPANVTLKAIGDDYNSAYRITTSRDAEYFLVENRQQTGWDKYIPGHGMLIWHIDYNASVWRQNTVNNTPARQRVDIEEADNIQTEGSRAADAFPGIAKVTEFTDDTQPSMLTWSNVRLEKPITDIRESNKTIFFQFKGGVIEDSPSLNLLAPTDLTAEYATLNWSAVSGVSEYFVDVENVDGTKLVNRVKVNDTSYKVTGLTCDTKYIYTVYYRSDDFYAGKTSEFETPFGTVDFHTVNVLAASGITANSFTSNWEALEGAESYSVTVYNTVTIPSQSSTANFDNKTVNEGWTSDSKSWATIDGYYGESAPSISFATDNNYLQSPLFDLPVATLTFGARGRQNGNSTLDICVPDGEGGWTVVDNIKPATTAWKTFSYDTSKLGPDAYQIRLVHRKGSMSNIVIDDVKIVTQEGREYLPMAGKTDISAGSATSMVVDGLEAGTLYFYSVLAHQGSLVSRDSRKVAVYTAGTSAIDEVGADSDAVSCHVVGDMLEVTTADAAQVEVYTVSGMLVVSDVKDAGVKSYRLGADGIYVVKVGNKAYKLVK
ncbi:MAG: M6 family metalloprotease domain-containing protein [Muribaculum sp.]|nr:M6 family metalloprotease domain-containing protein [Muribaculum sp.]